MNPIIEKSLNHSMTYEEYRDLIKQLVEKHSTTGFEKTEANINFTMLNDRRMRRWDKTLKLNDQAVEAAQRLHEHVTWLVITESWCGDAAHVLPVFNKLVETNRNIDLRIVLRDENENLMNMFLTNGTSSIPKLIMINDHTGHVVETYGPRPSLATQMVNNYKAEHGRLSPEFKEDLQRWYNQNKGENIIEDLTKMLCGVEPSICQ